MDNSNTDVQSAQIFKAKYDDMYPSTTYLERTGEPCRLEGCPCEGNGEEARRVTIETRDN